jgi:hypothetical protein
MSVFLSVWFLMNLIQFIDWIISNCLTQIGTRKINRLPVTPAKAGVQDNRWSLAALDSRFRGNDDNLLILRESFPVSL